MELPNSLSFGLGGKRALITGAGRGIGLGAAAVLAEAGAHVTLVSRSPGEIDAVAEAIGKRGGTADAVALDITDLAGFAAFVSGSEPFDIFINSAGMNRPRNFVDVSESDFDDIMALNLRASFFAAQAVVRRLIAAGKPGSIINISSQMGHVGAARRTVYCASKWALEGLTKAIAIEVAPHGIRVNTLAPTFIETPMTAPFLADPDFRAETLSKIKLGRLGHVEDLTGAIVFLASDASSLMTGSSLVIDGGWTAE